MGLHPGPDLDLYAAANLTGLSLPETRRAMAHLVRSHLTTVRPAQRYTMHDLLRAYAAEVAHAELAEEGCRAAVGRLLTFYRHTVVQLRRLLLPAYEKDLAADEPAVAMPIGDDTAGGRWVEAERANLVATVVDAGRRGFPDYAPTMTLCLWIYLSNRGYSNDCLTLSTAAVAAARAAGDALAEADALNDLAGSLMTVGRYAETIEYGERALQLSRAAGITPDDEARLLYNLVEVYLTVGDMQAAKRHAEEALLVSRRSTDPFTEADANMRLALLHRDTGSLDEALAYATAAVQVYEPSHYVRDKGEAFITLGTVYLRLEAYDRARHYLLRSQELFRSSGQYGGALGWTLDHLGTLSRRVGERQAAARYLTESLELARAINDPGLQADALTELGLLAHEQGRTGEGVRHVEDALALSTGTGHRRTEAPAHNALAEMLLAMGDVPGARQHFSAALEVATALEDPDEQDRARTGLRHRCPARDGAA
jgi:tetratricopeptide (TPR) repeat protein